MIDIIVVEPKVGVEVNWRDDGRVLWVSVDGETVLRICQIGMLVIQNELIKTQIDA